MPVNVISLCRDSLNFIKNNQAAVLKLILILTLLSLVLSAIAQPFLNNFFNLSVSVDGHAIINEEALNRMPEVQRQNFTLEIISNLSKVLLITLVSILLFLSSSLAMIALIARQQNANFISISREALLSMPRLLLFIILAFSALVVITSCLISLVGPAFSTMVIFFIMTGLIFTPIIIIIEKINTLNAISLSFQCVYKRGTFTLVFPVIMVWLLFQFCGISLVSALPRDFTNSLIGGFLYSFISNLFSLFLLIYSFRCYLLTRNKN